MWGTGSSRRPRDSPALPPRDITLGETAETWELSIVVSWQKSLQERSSLFSFPPHIYAQVPKKTGLLYLLESYKIPMGFIQDDISCEQRQTQDDISCDQMQTQDDISCEQRQTQDDVSCDQIQTQGDISCDQMQSQDDISLTRCKHMKISAVTTGKHRTM